MQNKHSLPLLLLCTLILFIITYAIIDTFLPTEYSAYSLPLISIIPFIIIGTYFLKNKIWYLWILIPSLFTYAFSFADYSIIVIFTITLPIYLWYQITNIKNITFIFKPQIDIPIIILFIHVLYLFLTHPFGIGLDLTNEYIGGKGYLTFLGGIFALIGISTIQTKIYEFTKILHYSFLLVIVSSFIFFILEMVFLGDQSTLDDPTLYEKEEREMRFLNISTIILYIIFIKYKLIDYIKKPYILFSALIALALGFISGFRSRIAIFFLMFCIPALVYKRWASLLLIPILSLSAVSFIAVFKLESQLPKSLQRTLSIFPFLEVDTEILDHAQHSIDWRVNMWKYALDDRYNFIQDKFWGDGFSRDIHHYKANIYTKSFRLSSNTRTYEGDDGTMFLDGWHSGPIATINIMGYYGLSLYIIISVIGTWYAWKIMQIYKHHQYRLSILYICIDYILSIIRYLAGTGAPLTIPSQIFKLLLIKILFHLATKEGLYTPISTRKEYIPMMCRQANSEPA